MGGPLSVIFSDIFMTKLEDDVVRPLKPIFYKRFVDDTFNIRKKKNLGSSTFLYWNTEGETE